MMHDQKRSRASNVQVERTESGARIAVRARRNRFLTLFLGFWLTVWILLGLPACIMLFTTGDPLVLPFALIFTIVWLFGLVVNGGWFLWLVKGRQWLEIAGGSLVAGYRIGPWTKERRFHFVRVTNPRVTRGALATIIPDFVLGLTPFSSSMFKVSVAFDHVAETVRWGKALTRGDAEAVVSELDHQLNGDRSG